MENITYIELPEPKPSKRLLEKIKWLAEHMFYYNVSTWPMIIRDKNGKV
jgi:hypothetical protein